MTDNRIPPAAMNRFYALQAEEKIIQGAQVGTQTPKVFFDTEDVIINPSNVGSGIISRMLTTDDTIFSGFSFVVLMIVSKIGDYHHENPKIKDFVHRFLKRMKEPTWRQAMEAMCSAKGFGFSVSEIIWGLNKELQKVPVRVATYHPSTLAFEVDGSGCVSPNGILQWTLQYSQYGNPNAIWTEIQNGWRVKNPFTTPVDRLMPKRIPFIYDYGLARIPRKKVIHHVNVPSLSFGNPYGISPARVAHLAWQLKVFLMKQLGIAAKRNATNTIWATAPFNQNKLKVMDSKGGVKELTPTEAMKELLKQRESDDAVITGPESAGYKLESLSNEANLPNMVEAIRFCDVMIFRCFLMPSLIMTDGSAGNRSLGDKHFDIVDKMTDNESEQFGTTIINDMVEPAVVDNFGEQEDYGHFTKRPQSLEERERLTQMFVTAAGGGAILKTYSETDMSYMRSTVGFPKDTDKTAYVRDPEEGTSTEPANKNPPGEKTEE